MKLKKLKEAKREAFRFLEKISILEKMLGDLDTNPKDIQTVHGRESASVIRSSLDLSIALSDLRKN